MSALLDLAERCEKAEGPAETLFPLTYQIAKAIGWREEPTGDGPGHEWWVSPDGEGWPRLPNYTASLDAALMLVPEGWRVSRLGEQQESDDRGEYVGGWWTCLHWPLGGIVHNLKWGKGVTPALALCAAALRARAAQ